MTDDVVEVQDAGKLTVTVKDHKVIMRLGLSAETQALTGVTHSEIILEPSIALWLGELILARAFEASI